MSNVSLADSICRVQQAQAVLSVWLNLTTTDDGDTADLLGAVLTLLNGIPDIMDAAEDELCAMDALKRSGGKA